MIILQCNFNIRDQIEIHLMFSCFHLALIVMSLNYNHQELLIDVVSNNKLIFHPKRADKHETSSNIPQIKFVKSNFEILIEQVFSSIVM